MAIFTQSFFANLCMSLKVSHVKSLGAKFGVLLKLSTITLLEKKLRTARFHWQVFRRNGNTSHITQRALKKKKLLSLALKHLIILGNFFLRFLYLQGRSSFESWLPPRYFEATPWSIQNSNCGACSDRLQSFPCKWSFSIMAAPMAFPVSLQWSCMWQGWQDFWAHPSQQKLLLAQPYPTQRSFTCKGLTKN